MFSGQDAVNWNKKAAPQDGATHPTPIAGALAAPPTDLRVQIGIAGKINFLGVIQTEPANVGMANSLQKLL